jgi:hypothetical protein
MAIDWHYRDFKDGTQQWMPLPEDRQGWPPTILIESERDISMMRKQWFIVDRTAVPMGTPPKIAGPFDTADAAKAAFIIRYT